jgi:hypothetical protein
MVASKTKRVSLDGDDSKALPLKEAGNELLCGISKKGRLLESGRDPITRQCESRNSYVQTQGSGSSWANVLTSDLASSWVTNDNIAMELKKSGIDKTSSSAQVLRLVVSLLGMEVHEQPSNWAQVWLTFKDESLSTLGLTPHIGDQEAELSAEKSAQYGDNAERWQLRVLRHLKERVAKRRSAAAYGGISANGDAIEDFGSDFDEHLELAEFALRRISHAVTVLQNPNLQERPMLLRGYTEEMLLEVAADLRRWLDQLATLLSLYHVHLLDLAGARSALEAKVKANEARLEESRRDRKTAVVKCESMQERWDETKLKMNANQQLGISLGAEDTKIYSQADVDALSEEWNKEQVEPLMSDIKDLKIKVDDLQHRIADKDRRIRELCKEKDSVPDRVEAPVETGLSKATQAVLTATLNGVAERITDEPLMRSVLMMAESVPKTGDDFHERLQDIFNDIQRIPIPPESSLEHVTGDHDSKCQSKVVLEPQHPAMKYLSLLTDEFENLEQSLRACPVASGADKLGSLATWCKDVAKASHAILSAGDDDEQPFRLPQAPKWDLGVLAKSSKAIRSIGVNTSDTHGEGASAEDLARMRVRLEDEWKQRMKSLQVDLEERIRVAQEASKLAQEKAEDALCRLEEESKKSDATLAALRRKLQQMQELLKAKGLGKEAGEALADAGLSSFLQEWHDRNVFERLYQDALKRMRHMNEVQQAAFVQNSEYFLSSVKDFFHDDGKLPGLGVRYIDEAPRRVPELMGKRAGSQEKQARLSPDDRRMRSKDCDPGRAAFSDNELLPPLNVLQLLEPQHEHKLARRTEEIVERPEGSFKTRLRSTSPSPDRDANISAFAIGSAPKTMPGAFPSIADKGRPMPLPSGGYPKAPGALAEGEILPPLYCRGQGSMSKMNTIDTTVSSSDSPISLKKQHLDSQRSQSTAPGGSSPSTLTDSSRVVSKDLKEIEPLLSIASYRMSPSQSLLLLPYTLQAHVAGQQSNQSKRDPARRGELAKLMTSRSAPHLNMPGGIPRLLVQSVQGAY